MLARVTPRRCVLPSLLLVVLLALSTPAQASPAAQQPVQFAPLAAHAPPDASGPPTSLKAQGLLKRFSPVADAEVQEGNPDTNFGIQQGLTVGFDANRPEPPSDLAAPKVLRALVRFDIASYLPPGTTVHAATLRMKEAGSGFCDEAGIASPFTIHPLGDDWSEMDVTWNDQPESGSVLGSWSIPIIEDVGSWYELDITSLARDWINGTAPEYGLIIKGPETSRRVNCKVRTFWSKGGGGFKERPVIEVDYTLPPPALAVSSQSLIFFHTCGSGTPVPAPKTIEVHTTSLDVKTWNARLTSGSDWVHLSKTSGSASHALPDVLAVSVGEPANCKITQSAEIEIRPDDQSLGLQTIGVSLRGPIPYRIFLPKAEGGNPDARPSPPVRVRGLAADPANRIAILVGVAEYEHLKDPDLFTTFRTGAWGENLLFGLSDLAQAAKRFAASGWRTRTLGNSNATAAGIGEAWDQVEDEVKNNKGQQPQADSDTTVLFYFSGHGSQATDQAPRDEADGFDEFLGIYDTNINPLTHALLDDALNTRLTALGASRVVVILDACHSGGMEIQHPRRAVLAGSREDQNSWETNDLEHGVLTSFMLRATRDPASDSNHNGWLSIREMHAYAAPLAEDYTRNLPPPPDIDPVQNLHIDVTEDIDVLRMMP